MVISASISSLTCMVPVVPQRLTVRPAMITPVIMAPISRVIPRPTRSATYICAPNCRSCTAPTNASQTHQKANEVTAQRLRAAFLEEEGEITRRKRALPTTNLPKAMTASPMKPSMSRRLPALKHRRPKTREPGEPWPLRRASSRSGTAAARARRRWTPSGSHAGRRQSGVACSGLSPGAQRSTSRCPRPSSCGYRRPAARPAGWHRGRLHLGCRGQPSLIFQLPARRTTRVSSGARSQRSSHCAGVVSLAVFTWPLYRAAPPTHALDLRRVEHTIAVRYPPHQIPRQGVVRWSDVHFPVPIAIRRPGSLELCPGTPVRPSSVVRKPSLLASSKKNTSWSYCLPWLSAAPLDPS